MEINPVWKSKERKGEKIEDKKTKIRKEKNK